MRADPDHLLLSMPMRYFAAVAQGGSVTAAARQLHVAPSAVSRQVSLLEDSLGLRLFERAQRGMRLTDSGQALAQHLAQVLAQAESALGQVRGLHQAAAQRVHLACTEGLATGALPAVLADFRQRHPGLLLTLTVTDPDGVLALLAARQADLGWVFALGRPSGCTVHHEAQAPMVAFMRPGHPLAGQRRVRLADVVRHPLLLGSPGTTARRLFDQACASRGLVAQAVVTANTLGPMLTLLGPRDVGVAAQLSVAQALAQGQLVTRAFARGQLASRRVQVLSARGAVLSPLAAELAQALSQALEITDTTGR